MPCGAALYFDPITDVAIRGLWQTIEDAGQASKMLSMNYPPHLTLMVCEDSHVDALRQILPVFLKNSGPISVDFHSLGVFLNPESVVYLAPTVSEELIDFHRALWEEMRPHLENYSALYQPGNWVPHVTLNLEVPPLQVGQMVNVLLSAHLPRLGVLREFQYSELTDDQPIELIKVALEERL
jgi:2'-5' RNA ligase